MILLVSGNFWQVASKLPLSSIHVLKYDSHSTQDSGTTAVTLSLLDPGSFIRRMKLCKSWAGGSDRDLLLKLGPAAGGVQLLRNSSPGCSRSSGRVVSKMHSTRESEKEIDWI